MIDQWCKQCLKVGWALGVAPSPQSQIYSCCGRMVALLTWNYSTLVFSTKAEPTTIASIQALLPADRGKHRKEKKIEKHYAMIVKKGKGAYSC